MTEREKYEEHIKSAAWYKVLSEAAKDDDDGASIFRMARMAASEAWQASRRAALEEIAAHFDEIAEKQKDLPITPDFAARQVRALGTGDEHE